MDIKLPKIGKIIGRRLTFFDPKRKLLQISIKLFSFIGAKAIVNMKVYIYFNFGNLHPGARGPGPTLGGSSKIMPQNSKFEKK